MNLRRKGFTTVIKIYGHNETVRIFFLSNFYVVTYKQAATFDKDFKK